MMSRLRSAAHARRYDDRGFVAGADMLIFGVVTFLIGSLLIINVWAVIDTSLAVSAAAREGARAYAETGENGADARDAALKGANQTISNYGKTGPVTVKFSGSHARCALITVTVEYDVATVSLPVFGDLGTRTVTADHSNLVDAWRSGEFTGDC